MSARIPVVANQGPMVSTTTILSHHDSWAGWQNQPAAISRDQKAGIYSVALKFRLMTPYLDSFGVGDSFRASRHQLGCSMIRRLKTKLLRTDSYTVGSSVQRRKNSTKLLP
jgi:hypothetical protein